MTTLSLGTFYTPLAGPAVALRDIGETFAHKFVVLGGQLEFKQFVANHESEMIAFDDAGLSVDNLPVVDMLFAQLGGKMRGDSENKKRLLTVLGYCQKKLPQVILLELHPTVRKQYSEQSSLLARLRGRLQNLGYKSVSKILNAKDYGDPQNRRKLFLVAIRKDRCYFDFEFPRAVPLQNTFGDIMEVPHPTDLDISQLRMRYVLERPQTHFLHAESEIAPALCGAETATSFSRHLILYQRDGVEHCRIPTPGECLQLAGYPLSTRQAVSRSCLSRFAAEATSVGCLVHILRKLIPFFTLQANDEKSE